MQEEKITESILASPEIKLCDGKVVINESADTSNLKLFLIKDFSSKLTEGPIQLEVYPDDAAEQKQTFNLNVIWIGKTN